MPASRLKRIPPKPRTRAELAAVVLSISYVRRRRSARQEQRQERAFALHVGCGVPVRQVARRLKCSKNTVTADCYFEGRRRSDELDGTFVPYHRQQPERVIRKADLNLLLAVWAARDERKLTSLLDSLEAEDAHRLGQRTYAREEAA